VSLPEPNYTVSAAMSLDPVYELPMGITARELIYEHGGGIKNNKKLKAFSPGGISSGILPAAMVDISLDYDPLAKAGSMLGSGAMIVMDETTCMVDMTLRASHFFVHECCGECTPCRVGNTRIEQLLTGIANGQGSWDDVQLLQELGERMRIDSRCGLGQSAALPFLSALTHFEEEFRAHVEAKKCPAGVCSIAPVAAPYQPEEVTI